MKKIIIAITLLAAGACIAANAQEPMKSGYFVENYNYRHQLNPAFASSRSYYALPGIGNLNATTQSNMGISTFLYPYNGQLTTFMNSSVSSEEFLGKLSSNNKLGVSVSVPLLSVGTWGKKGGFTTFEITTKTNVAMNLPYDLFDFMKNVGSKQNYNIGNLGVRSKVYTELAIGHAHKITDRLNVGAKLKILLGLANVDAKIDRMQVSMAEDSWSVDAKGSINASVPMLKVPTKGETGTAADPSQNNEIDFDAIGDSFEFDSVNDVFSSLSAGLGYGAAIDLGATYEFDSGLLNGLNLSAAIIDLGFISWGNTVNAVTSPDPWYFDGFNDIAFDSESEGTLNDQINALGDDLADMLKFEKVSEGKRKANMLACTVNIGAEYEMPFYRHMSVGFLSSTKIQGPYSHSEGRFSLNIEPVKWFGFSTSYGISTFGSTWGAIVNFSFPGIGLFVGTDTIPTKLTAPIKGLGIGVPYNNLNLNVNFGLTFNLSKVRHLGEEI